MKHSIKALSAIAVIAVAVGALTGCAGGSGGDSGKVSLTLTTFGQFGYEDLIKKFEKENPNISVTHRKAKNGDEARDATNTYLAAGHGLGDVIAVESGWLAQMMQYPDKWTPVPKNLDGRWLDWKSAAATDAGGTLRMYGVDSAPVALCYDKDLFAQAGYPTDRAAVAKLLDGDWDHFFALGKQFHDKTGKPWTNAASAIGQAQVQGLEIAFQDRKGKVVAATNPDVKAAYDSVVAQTGITANMPTFGEDWTKGLGQDSFAVQVCPSWMLGIISSSAPDSTAWDVASVFPGNGISWGGSYLAVPTQTQHPKEAQKLAAWLTAPEQQLAAFDKVGAFPSQTKALSDSSLLATKTTYFQDAPSGEIFAERAKAIKVRPYNGPLSSQIMTFFNNAVDRVEAGTMNADDSWSKFKSDVASISK